MYVYTTTSLFESLSYCSSSLFSVVIVLDIIAVPHYLYL